MEYLLAEYGVAAAFLLGGVLFMWLGWRYYARLSRWLTESKKTTAEVIDIGLAYDDNAGELDQPTFRYQTTGEILVTKSKQLFDKGLLKVGGFHTIRYNSRTPGKVQSDMAGDEELMVAFFLFGLGGFSCFIALMCFLVKLG